ncbi:MAG: prepilin-type N-terminal cleavage/methylation domain-containing protein [Candidatus Omnitrophica bacterium]|nr:prepilin-type N-terminal cleavage/methylation domain-containing protein [Candidatus Omnitrophota bacterium]
MKNHKGFTLTELVMLIVIIGIVALVAMPKASTGSAVRLEAACQKIASDLRYAQEMSLAQQVRLGISFDPVNEAYFVYRVNVGTVASDPQTRNNFNVSFVTLNEFKGIDIASTSFNNKVEFDSVGAPYDGNGVILSSQGVITLQAQGGVYSRTVRIEAKTGKVSVQ